jgi:hypothetical protein
MTQIGAKGGAQAPDFAAFSAAAIGQIDGIDGKTGSIVAHDVLAWKQLRFTDPLSPIPEVSRGCVTLVLLTYDRS